MRKLKLFLHFTNELKRDNNDMSVENPRLISSS